MKTVPFFLLFVPVTAIVVGTLLWQAPGSADMELEWKTIPEAIREAKESRKKILIDVYTDWCTWCKKMEQDTYDEKSVRSYLTEHFVLARLDAESKSLHLFGDGKYTEQEIATAFGVDGYPTTIFLSRDAEMITSVPGYLPPDTFLAVLEYIQTDAYMRTNWQDFSREKGIGEE